MHQKKHPEIKCEALAVSSSHKLQTKLDCKILRNVKLKKLFMKMASEKTIKKYNAKCIQLFSGRKLQTKQEYIIGV